MEAFEIKKNDVERQKDFLTRQKKKRKKNLTQLLVECVSCYYYFQKVKG